MSFEFPLVFFTVLTELGVGLAIFICLHLFANPNGADKAAVKKTWICATIVSCLGVLLSLFHLGHPFSAYKALYNLGASWLSWEGLGFACFCLLAFINIFRPSRALALLAAFVGAFSLFAQGMTYSPPSIPALHNAIPMALFWLSALALGSCAAGIHLRDKHISLSRLLIFALLIILLAAPAIWISGSATMRESGILWSGSPWFWGGVILVALSLAGTWLFADKNPKLQMICLLCGILCTRMVFFADSVHTAVNLGLPFN